MWPAWKCRAGSNGLVTYLCPASLDHRVLHMRGSQALRSRSIAARAGCNWLDINLHTLSNLHALLLAQSLLIIVQVLLAIASLQYLLGSEESQSASRHRASDNEYSAISPLCCFKPLIGNRTKRVHGSEKGRYSLRKVSLFLPVYGTT